jgi:Photosynthetic reaction centre cytochrome C subunit
MRTVVVLTSFALVALACSRTSPGSAPAPVVAAGQAPGGPGGAGAPGGAPRRRVPPNPMQQDTVRRAAVDSIMRTIAGRESLPAGTVFQNVKELKDMPAGEFLKTMDEQYGRGLGWTCTNCHVAGKFDDDSKKNKRIARQMQVMQNYINNRQLARVKELDAEYDKATCVMCHRGANEPKGEMAVPMPTVPAAQTAPLPPRDGR